jgi:PAS domain S-box-containing protein
LNRTYVTTEQLLAEVTELRQRVSELEAAQSEWLRLEGSLRQRNRDLTLLNCVADESVAGVEPGRLLRTACRELARALSVPQAKAYLRNERNAEATAVAEYMVGEDPSWNGRGIRATDGPICDDLNILESPLVVTGPRAEPSLKGIQSRMRRRGLQSLLALPITAEGEVVGSVELGAVVPRQFSAEEVSLAWQACEHVSRAISRTSMTQAQRQLNIAIDQTTEGVIVTDTQGIVLYVNPALERMSGYTRSEVTGKTLQILGSGEHDAAFYRQIWSTIGDNEAWHGRLLNRRKDGTRYTVDATITPLRDENGSVVNYVSILRDVTRELELEQQHQQSQKMEILGQLTAGIAHDFNNVLTAVNGYAELLQVQLPPSDPAREMVSRVLNAGQRGADLVRQLLVFSRKQANRPQIVNLNRVVTEMQSMLQRIIGEHIHLTTNTAADLWAVSADPAQIEQIVINLVVNARDAMPSGGQLVIETANVILDRNYVGGHLDARPGEHVLLSISDTGVGMIPEVKAHLFEPFFTTKGRGQGTGLGLATVYGIVKQSGGSIWVYSEEGMGTAFKIYLPRACETVPMSSHAEPVRQARGGSETILLVEDDAAVRDLAYMVLQEQGYTVLVAADGQDALRQAGSHGGPIHLLLSDVVLPDMMATGIADTVRRQFPDIKTLFMSGYSREVMARQGAPQRGAAFLQKPFSSLDLTERVRAVLDDSTDVATNQPSGERTRSAACSVVEVGSSPRLWRQSRAVRPAVTMSAPAALTRR